MITLHDRIDQKTEPTRVQIGSWEEKTSIRSRNRLLGNECILFSYRSEEAPYRISLYLSDYDTINLRVRSRKKRPPANAQETLEEIKGLLIAQEAIPLEIQEHDDLPDITTLEKPCYIKIRGQEFPLYFANIDFLIYEAEYAMPSLVHKNLDFSPEPDVKEWHLNCVPVKPSFHALIKAIKITCAQLQVPQRVIQKMVQTVNDVKADILRFMADLIETQNENSSGLGNLINPHMHYNKDYAYLLRIIERMILGNQFKTAVTLAQIFKKDDPHYVTVQALANKALLVDEEAPHDKEAYFENLIKTRLNIAMITRDPNDIMLIVTAMNELAGGTGFLSQSQHNDNNALGTLLVQAALAIRESRAQAANRTVPIITTAATSPLQPTSEIQTSPPEPVSHTLIFSQTSNSRSQYSLIDSHSQRSLPSETSHVAVSEACTYHPTRKRSNTI